MTNFTSKANRLATESSPYLLLHANNPVDWYPWGDEAFNKAKIENKLLIVSIGYAACHWCHVMEHESFSNPNVAEIMNKFFISVKVDREERPDIDSIYMSAVQIITGQGGWPLNAIVLPDGKPIYAGTYFPRENWIELLNQIQHLYSTNSENLLQQANHITERIHEFSTSFINQSNNRLASKETINNTIINLLNKVDFINGGLDSAPKFPMPIVFQYLLHFYEFSRNIKVLDAITVTLSKMAMGGIYDHIGGGFARYSTDNYWKVPHFEKMLYDNAQLVSLYSNAFKLTKNVRYSEVVVETLEFIENEMTLSESGFYSAIDADSEGEEGKFYVWAYDEFKNGLGEDDLYLIDYYTITEYGNWEHGFNILYTTHTDSEFIHEKGITPEALKRSIEKFRETKLEIRNMREKPLTDTKIIASWNALMISGYLDAYSALGNDQYLLNAIKNAQFIEQKLINRNNLFRNYKDHKCYTNAKLDDYANVINAFIFLYQCTFDEHWLIKALELNEHTLCYFFDSESEMFFYTSDLDEKLISRQFEITDQVIPSSNSVMALNLFYLGTLFEKPDYLSKAETMLMKVQENIAHSPAYFANWAKLQLLFANPPFEVAIVGEKCIETAKALSKYFLPNVIFMGCVNSSSIPFLQHKYILNQTYIYICKNKVCNLPVSCIDEALTILIDHKNS